MKKLKTLVLLACTALATASACAQVNRRPAAPAKAAKQSGFVKVKGRHFELDGKPYYFAGANLWYGMYLGSPGSTGDRARLLRELDDLAGKGIRNLRVLAVSEASTLKRAVTPAVMQAPDKVDETLWQGLDFLLDEMARRDMKAVLYLNNFWQWSGGMSQYIAWFNGKPVMDPDVTGDWNAFMDNSASFYREPQAQQAYRRVIEAAGEAPQFAEWALLFDGPRPSCPGSWPTSRGRAAMHMHARTSTCSRSGWTRPRATSRRWRPSSWSAPGNEGWMGTAGSRELFESAHHTPNVDYLTYHMWAPNWSWFNPKQAAATYDAAWKQMQDYLHWHIDTANRMGKPIVLEEFGINRDAGSFEASATTVYRDRFYKEIYALLESRAAAGDAIAGSNFWAWGGEGRTKNADFMWKAGDGFVGDPPQEPQGLYCVFDSDASTIAIIQAHAGRMAGMQPAK
jgi:mannan endo-1,4-beta-mannosidase